MTDGRIEPAVAGIQGENWQSALGSAVRDPAELLERLKLPASLLPAAIRAAKQFPLLAPLKFLERMEPGNPRDPLLLQVLPLDLEEDSGTGFQDDALEEFSCHIATGVLQKYSGRALMIVTGVCAVHCRYCFRRHYPYENEPRRLEEWRPAIEAISLDESIQEILLSGGDPLTLSDRRLTDLCVALDAIPHLHRLRFHTRLPIVIPSRVTDGLIQLVKSLRVTPIFVVHANHPREMNAECAHALRQLVNAGITVLNQSVLLRGINDSADALTELSLKLVDLGVMPYYLHQLDRVTGTTHFEVSESAGRELIQELQTRLPGYAVPRYVREIPGESYKTPLTG